VAVSDRDVYEEIAPDLMRYATVLVGADYAPGVFSTVVTRALHRSRGLAGLGTPRTYLMRAVLKEVSGVKRRRSTVDGGLPEVDVEVGNVDNLVTELPTLQRAAAYLLIFLDYSPTEAAEAMGKRPGSVRRYLQLARKNLAALDDDRTKEAFRRITANTPDAPAFSDLQERPPRRRFKAWMAAAVAVPLVLIVAIALGIFDGGESAAPGTNTIDYIKLEYSGSAQADCTEGEVIDNFGHLEATIEIWGPNSDDLTLVVATFPDGSMERTVIEGSVENPVRGWGRDPTDYPDDTSLRVIGCETSGSEVLPLLEGFNLPDRGPIPPSWFLSPRDQAPGVTFSAMRYQLSWTGSLPCCTSCVVITTMRSSRWTST
jgi:DNA-directed RNA polymerase specialized sigma24 family protein